MNVIAVVSVVAALTQAVEVEIGVFLPGPRPPGTPTERKPLTRLAKSYSVRSERCLATKAGHTATQRKPPKRPTHSATPKEGGIMEFLMHIDVADLLIRQEMALADEGIGAKDSKSSDAELLQQAVAVARDRFDDHDLWEIALLSDELHQDCHRWPCKKRLTNLFGTMIQTLKAGKSSSALLGKQLRTGSIAQETSNKRSKIMSVELTEVELQILIEALDDSIELFEDCGDVVNSEKFASLQEKLSAQLDLISK